MYLTVTLETGFYILQSILSGQHSPSASNVKPLPTEIVDRNIQNSPCKIYSIFTNKL